MYQPQLPIYSTVFISSGQPWTSNHSDMQYLYLFTNIAMVVTTSEYGGIVLPQNQWTLFPYPDGQKVYSPTFPTGVYLITLATNDVLATDSFPRFGLNAYERAGQAYSATTGWQHVGTISNFIALQITGNASTKNIQIVRMLAATELITPPPCFLSQVNNNFVNLSLMGQLDPINNIANHAVNLSFASGVNFQSSALVYTTAGGGGLTSLLGITGLVEACPPGTIDLLQGTTRTIQKGTVGSLVGAIRMPDTTHMGAISVDWYEEI